MYLDSDIYTKECFINLECENGHLSTNVIHAIARKMFNAMSKIFINEINSLIQFSQGNNAIMKGDQHALKLQKLNNH